VSNDFRRRWGLPEEDFDKRFQKSIYRILAFTGNIITTQERWLRTFALIAGVPVGVYGGVYRDTFNAEKYFLEAKQPCELAEKIEDLLKSRILTDIQKESICRLVNNESIGIRISKDKKGNYITYPQGEPMLDEKVVERTLSSIDGKSASEYTEALKAYNSGRWNDSSNKTRRALEEYLRQYLNNKAGFKANINTMGDVLKKADIADHFRNSIINQLRTLDSHYNSGSKHSSKTQGAVEAEYLIYSVGVIVNTLERLKISGKGAL
jgi:glycine--tRNA ligase